MDNRQRPRANIRHNTRNHPKPLTACHTTPGRLLIALTIGEIRRLFNLTDKNDHSVKLGLYWSA